MLIGSSPCSGQFYPLDNAICRSPMHPHRGPGMSESNPPRTVERLSPKIRVMVVVRDSVRRGIVPELPELEVSKRCVDSTSMHQRIEKIEVKDSRVLGDVSADGLERGLEGRMFESTRRYGKHLFVGLDNGEWLLLHFGM